MWPDLFGTGWGWNVLVSGGSLACFLALVWLFGDARPLRGAPDLVQRVWQKYEQGDLTRYEFDRLIGAAAPAVLTEHRR